MQEKRTKTEKTTQPPAKNINSEGISMGESTKNEARASYPTLDAVMS